MLSYCLKCRKKNRHHKPECNKCKNTIMVLSKCIVGDSKKLRFIKEQEAIGLLTSLLEIK